MYAMYKFILPSARSVGDFMHLKALHQETVAAKALVNVDGDTSVTLHYSTARWSRVDGEWPSLILNFLNDNHIDKSKMYYLSAIFFALENREQIVKLFV